MYINHLYVFSGVEPTEHNISLYRDPIQEINTEIEQKMLEKLHLTENIAQEADKIKDTITVSENADLWGELNTVIDMLSSCKKRIFVTRDNDERRKVNQSAIRYTALANAIFDELLGIRKIPRKAP